MRSVPARDVNEMLRAEIEMRPRRWEMRFETVSRPRRRDRDYIPGSRHKNVDATGIMRPTSFIQQHSTLCAVLLIISVARGFCAKLYLFLDASGSAHPHNSRVVVVAIASAVDG